MPEKRLIFTLVLCLTLAGCAKAKVGLNKPCYEECMQILGWHKFYGENYWKEENYRDGELQSSKIACFNGCFRKE